MAAQGSAEADPRARLLEICLALPEVSASGDQHIRFAVRNKRFAYYLEDHHGDSSSLSAIVWSRRSSWRPWYTDSVRRPRPTRRSHRAPRK